MGRTELTALAAAFCISTIAAAAEIEPAAQNRSTLGDAISIGAKGNIQDIDQHQADDFARFADQLATASQSGTAMSTVDAWQDSVIGPCALLAAGGFHAAGAIGPDATHAYAIGSSSYEVTFDIDAVTPFEITGTFDVDGQTRFSVELHRGTDALIFDSFPGPAEAQSYHNAGTLQPGQYRLRFQVFGSADTLSSVSDVRDAHFHAQLRTCGPQQDITGDGVVDLFDLLQLLDDWGACPGTPVGDCLSDLDSNRVVDLFDLLAMLDNWGS